MVPNKVKLSGGPVNLVRPAETGPEARCYDQGESRRYPLDHPAYHQGATSAAGVPLWGNFRAIGEVSAQGVVAAGLKPPRGGLGPAGPHELPQDVLHALLDGAFAVGQQPGNRDAGLPA